MSQKTAHFTVAAAIMALAFTMGCEKGAPAVSSNDAGSGVAPQAKHGAPNHSFHIQLVKAQARGDVRRAKFAPAAYGVVVQGLSGAEAKEIKEGVCKGLSAAPGGPRCGEPTEGRRLRVKLWSLGKSSTVLMGGDVALADAKTAPYLFDYLLTSAEDPSSPGWRSALGEALARRWLTDVTGELVGARQEVLSKGPLPAGQGLKWVDQPGLRLRELWPPSEGRVVMVKDKAWSVQASAKGEVAAFLFDAAGRILSKQRFEIEAAPSLAGAMWVADHFGDRLLMTSRLVEEGDGVAPVAPNGVVVAALDRDGRRVVAKVKGVEALGGAWADWSGNLYLPALSKEKVTVFEIDAKGEVKAQWAVPVKIEAGSPLAVRGLEMGGGLQGVILGEGYDRVFVKAADGAVELWSWSETSKRPASSRAVPIVPDAKGGALVLAIEAQSTRVVRLDAGGKTLWEGALPGAFETLALVGDRVAVGGDKLVMLALSDGAKVGESPRRVRAITEGAGGRVVACTPEGVAAYKPDGTFVKAFGRSRGCDVIRGHDAGFNAGLFPSVFGVSPVASW